MARAVAAAAVVLLKLPVKLGQEQKTRGEGRVAPQPMGKFSFHNLG